MIDSIDKDICEIVAENPDEYKRQNRKLDDIVREDYQVNNRLRRYRNSTTIVNFNNSANLAGDEFELANFLYYCNNTSKGVMRKGIIGVSDKLIGFLDNFRLFVETYTGPYTMADVVNAIYLFDT